MEPEKNFTNNSNVERKGFVNLCIKSKNPKDELYVYNKGIQYVSL